MTTRTGGIKRCDYRVVQKKPAVLYGDASTLEYLIAAMKQLQCVPLQRRQDCRLTTVCTNETQKILASTYGQQSLNPNPIQ
jgi:hypothetical protein